MADEISMQQFFLYPSFWKGTNPAFGMLTQIPNSRTHLVIHVYISLAVNSDVFARSGATRPLSLAQQKFPTCLCLQPA